MHAKPDKKIYVFQCNSFEDGNGDIGNLVEVSQKIIESLGSENITPYFVITSHLMNDDLRHYLPDRSWKPDPADPDKNIWDVAAENMLNASQKSVEQAVIRFKEEAGFAFKHFKGIDIDKQTFSFVSTNHGIHYDNTTWEHPQFRQLLEDSKSLRHIYTSADAIYTIATPFPQLPRTLNTREDVQRIAITEHYAKSYDPEAIQLHTSHPPNHYVTGIGESFSGLMVSDLSCDQEGSIQALQAITDKKYIEELGLKYPVSHKEAKAFLHSTCIVPVYLGETQQKDLPVILHMISQSPFAKDFEKIVFHVNKRAYDETTFQKIHAELDSSMSMPSKLIVGHYFADPDDFKRIYQLSSGRGIAVCSSDKVLELAISCNLLPLYPPVLWKKQVNSGLITLAGQASHWGSLLDFLRNTSAVNPRTSVMLEAFKRNPVISNHLSVDTLVNWEEQRKLLLDNSFFKVLEGEILKHDKESLQSDTTANPSSIGLFSQTTSENTQKVDKKPDDSPLLTP